MSSGIFFTGVVFIKYIPNIITVLRIVLSIFLFWLEPFSAVFFVIYLICGATDVFDGMTARALKAQSQTGALLDSIADVIFFGALILIFLPMIFGKAWIIYWIIGILIIKIASVSVCAVKYHRVIFLHTYLNKLSGIVLFCFPLFYLFLNLDIVAAVICTIATIASAEELVINIRTKMLDLNVSSIFKTL